MTMTGAFQGHKFEDFVAGHWQPRYQYKSFEPVPVNVGWSWQEPAVNTLLEQATRALGELNAFSLIVPDIDLFIRMHVIKEAQSSSRIEGTQTGIDEAVMAEEHISPEKREDWHEVQNHIGASDLESALGMIQPTANRMINALIDRKILVESTGQKRRACTFSTVT